MKCFLSIFSIFEFDIEFWEWIHFFKETFWKHLYEQLYSENFRKTKRYKYFDPTTTWYELFSNRKYDQIIFWKGNIRWFSIKINGKKRLWPYCKWFNYFFSCRYYCRKGGEKRGIISNKMNCPFAFRIMLILRYDWTISIEISDSN